MKPKKLFAVPLLIMVSTLLFISTAQANYPQDLLVGRDASLSRFTIDTGRYEGKMGRHIWADQRYAYTTRFAGAIISNARRGIVPACSFLNGGAERWQTNTYGAMYSFSVNSRSQRIHTSCSSMGHPLTSIPYSGSHPFVFMQLSIVSSSTAMYSFSGVITPLLNNQGKRFDGITPSLYEWRFYTRSTTANSIMARYWKKQGILEVR